MPIELRYLRYVIAAAQEGSFRRAASALHVRQSTLSRQIRHTEDLLGVTLFERSNGGVRPTAAGQKLLRSARHILAEAETVVASARSHGRGEAGYLAVGFCASLSAGNLRATLIEHAQRFPHVEIRAVEGSRSSLLRDLQNGAIDVAIVIGDRRSRGGTTMMLWSERIIVAFPEGHPQAASSIVRWSDLRGQRFLLSQRDPGPDLHDILVANLTSPGERPNVVQHDVCGENIICLVSAGFGISIICEASAGANFAGVVYREVQDRTGPCRIGYTAQWEENNANPALRRFLKLLEERYPLLSDG